MSDVQQCESVIHISPFYSFPSHLGHTEPWAEFPALYRRFSFITYFICSRVCVNSSHPLQADPLHLYLYFCFANRFIYTIFLDSTCRQYYMIFTFLFLTYFTLYDSLWLYPCLWKWHYLIFCGWVIFHCIYVPLLLYPFLCWWTLILRPCSGYCK